MVAGERRHGGRRRGHQRQEEGVAKLVRAVPRMRWRRDVGGEEGKRRRRRLNAAEELRWVSGDGGCAPGAHRAGDAEGVVGDGGEGLTAAAGAEKRRGGRRREAPNSARPEGKRENG